jgi:hypothetical protein
VTNIRDERRGDTPPPGTFAEFYERSLGRELTLVQNTPLISLRNEGVSGLCPACWYWPIPDAPPTCGEPWHEKSWHDADGCFLQQWQAGRCALCGTTDRSLVEDHDHATGLTRGYLCHSCNTREGFRRGILYVKYREVHPTRLLDLNIRYFDSFRGEYAKPVEPVEYDEWDDNAAAGLRRHQ